MGFKYKNAVVLTKFIMDDKINEGDIVVDATCGNGYDALYLSNIVGKEGKVYGFDIQKAAIDMTRANLIKNSKYKNWILINDGHQNVDKYLPSKINSAVFNLGYLPSGDHKIITTPHNTIEAVTKLMDFLLPGGVIIIVIYYGHEGGKEEKNALLNFTQSIDYKGYTVLKTEFINHLNCSPLLLVIEKSYGQDL